MEMTIDEKHELILSFDTSEEMWQFLKEHQDNVVGMVDYKALKGVEDGKEDTT
jgi:hypothetical protein